MQKFEIENFSDYLKNTIDEIKKDEIVDYSISTMNLFARPNSLVEKFLNILIENKFKVYYDEKLTERTYVLSDGHYVFKLIPRGPKKNRYKHISDKISSDTKQKYSEILVNLESRFYQTESKSNWLKKLFSRHPLQFLSASHIKIAPYTMKNGDKKVMITSGELSSESSQNNLAVTFKSDKAYDFFKKIINPNYKIGENLFEKCIVSEKSYLIADYGNYGSPGVISKIHQLAEEFIIDQPKNVLLITQYNPSGKMLRAINQAAKSGAHVTIPLEPVDDYRRRDGGFKFLFAKFKSSVNSNVNLPTRPNPSHIKCLIVKHKDDSLSMIFGSDNFDSWADHFYRNTEVSLIVNRANKKDDEYEVVQKTLDKLENIKEITSKERKLYK